MQSNPSQLISTVQLNSHLESFLWPVPFSITPGWLLICTNLAKSLFLPLILLTPLQSLLKDLGAQWSLKHTNHIMTLCCSTPSNAFITPDQAYRHSWICPVCSSDLTLPLSSHTLWWSTLTSLEFSHMPSSLPRQGFCILCSFCLLGSSFKLPTSGSFWIFMSLLRYYILWDVLPDPQCQVDASGIS